jgi:Tfp pilus assembly protein PilX
MLNNSKNGSAIIVVMCFMMVMSILAASSLKFMQSQSLIARSQINIENAFYIAEAGAQYGADYIAHGGATPCSFSGKIGNGTYYVTISEKTSAGVSSGISVNGVININPNNSPEHEFSLTKKDGSIITRDTLTQNYGGYVGEATAIHIKPKGNGNQNKLTVDGQAYTLHNSTTYDITSPSMNVAIYNDKINKQGKATGHWYISIGATDAEILP